MFPASEADITVCWSAIAHNRAVEPYGTGWDTLLNEMAYLRYQDRAADDVYYYGIFNPASSVYNYCSGGALGLQLVQDYRYAQGRVSIGLGFSGDESVNTMVHEVGHAQWREHAPCGLGGQPSDRYYPNNTGKIEDWGFDHRSSDLRSPGTFVDVMSYCSPSWISVYTMTHSMAIVSEKHHRLQRVAAAEERDIDMPWPILIEQADGELNGTRHSAAHPAPRTDKCRSEFTNDAGEKIGATSAFYLRFSHHMDGGFILMNPGDIPAGTVKVATDKATIEYQGRKILVQRGHSDSPYPPLCPSFSQNLRAFNCSLNFYQTQKVAGLRGRSYGASG